MVADSWTVRLGGSSASMALRMPPRFGFWAVAGPAATARAATSTTARRASERARGVRMVPEYKSSPLTLAARRPIIGRRAAHGADVAVSRAAQGFPFEGDEMADVKIETVKSATSGVIGRAESTARGAKIVLDS